MKIMQPSQSISYQKSNEQTICLFQIYVREYWKGKSKKDNPEKLETLDTQDEDKQTKNTTQYGLDTTIHKQTQIM